LYDGLRTGQPPLHGFCESGFPADVDRFWHRHVARFGALAALILTAIKFS